MPLLDRRRFLTLAGVGAAAALAPSCGDDEADRLVFLNWQDYVDRSLLRDFERDAGVSVVYSTYASNDELARRLGRAGAARRRGRSASTFDLIVPSDNLLAQLRRAGALRELGAIEGIDRLAPAFRRATFDPGNRFSIPWATGTTGIGYSKRAFPDGPPGWEVFLDDAVSGKATVLDETRDAMAVALFLLDEDPNTRDRSTIAAAGRKLRDVLANGVELDAATYLKRLRSGDTVVAHAFSTDIAQAAADDPDLAFVVPPAGGMRWIDSLCIPRQAPRPDLARRFIEFYLEPEVSAANAVAIGADTGNEAAREFLPAELLDSESFEAPAALASVLHFTEPLSDELEDAYASAFDAAKGG